MNYLSDFIVKFKKLKPECFGGVSANIFGFSFFQADIVQGFVNVFQRKFSENLVCLVFS